MPPVIPFFKRVSGVEGTGEVRAPHPGIQVGRFQNWELRRREDPPPGTGAWDLRAVFAYVNRYLWSEQRYAKEITVRVGPRRYRVVQTPGQRMVLNGNQLLMESVNLEPLEGKEQSREQDKH
jgi:hypothetical protein